MIPASLTLLLLVHAGGEWVEIAQQSYKKPVRPTHNHPILATIGIATESEKTTKANRIYINHSLPEDNWNTGSAYRVPNINRNGVRLESDSVIFVDRESYGDRRPTESVKNKHNVKGDIILVRKQKPGEAEDYLNQKPKRQKNPATSNVMRVRPTKEASFKRKPLEELEGPIEVFNLSDLEYVTSEDSTTEAETDMTSVRTTKRKHAHTTPTPEVVSRTKSGHSASNKNKQTKANSSQQYRRKNKPNEESTTKAPATSYKEIFTSKSNNIRRIDILRSTTPKYVNRKVPYRPNRPTDPPEEELEDYIHMNDENFESTVHNFPNTGQITRVQLSNKTRKTTHRQQLERDRYTSTELPYEEDILTIIPTTQTYTNRPVKSKTTPPKSTTEKTFPKKMNAENIRYQNRDVNDFKIPNPEDVMVEEILKEEEDKLEFKVHKVASVGSVKRVKDPTKSNTKDNRDNNKNYDQVKPYTDATAELETDSEGLVEDEESSDDFNKVIFTGKVTSSIDDMPVFTTSKPKFNKVPSRKTPNVSTQTESYDHNPYKPIKPFHQPVPEFVTKEEHFTFTSSDGDFENDFEMTTDSNTKVRKLTTESPRTVTTKEQNTRRDNLKPQRQKNKNTDERKISQEPLSSEAKPSTMENLIKFLKTVTDIITRNSRRGVQGKMQYLEDLRDTILTNIEERIEAAFPDDDAAGRRHARSAAQAQARGHVEFPSSEGALMTISFLTFAVFLIKLVLQLIHAYKNKAMMIPTMVAAVGRAFAGHRPQN